MKTTKLFLFVLCALLVNLLNAQTVTLKALTINGQSIPALAPINLGTLSTDVSVGLSVEVRTSTAPSDNSPGTISIYYRRSTFDPINIAIGGNGGNLLFLGGTIGSRNFIITLQNSQFFATGGIIYAEYETYAKVKYKSGNISIIKSSTAGGSSGNPPSTPFAYTENVPYGGVPLLPALPYVDLDKKIEWVKSNYRFEPVYNLVNVFQIGSPSYPSVAKNSETLYTIIYGSNTYTDLKNNFYLNVNMPYSQDRTDPFIFYKEIEVIGSLDRDQYIPNGSIPQTIFGQPGSIIQNRTIIIPATEYQWQKRIVRPVPDYLGYLNYITTYGWKDISGANELNYSPPLTTEVTQYRRLIIEPNKNPRRSATTNSVTIYPMSVFQNNQDSNVICCNQNIIPNSTINTITGSTFNGNYYTYQWQKQMSRNGIDYYWQNIDYANNKDYKPLGSSRSNNVAGKYRRIVIDNYDYKHYFSNEITIAFVSARMGSHVEYIDENDVNLYPNPSNSFVNITGMDISSCSISIIDISGRTLIRKPLGYYKDIQQIDITELPKGIYNLNLENSTRKISKKIIKK